MEKVLPMTALKMQNEQIASMKIKLAEDWKGTFRGLSKEEQMERHENSFLLIEEIQKRRMLEITSGISCDVWSNFNECLIGYFDGLVDIKENNRGFIDEEELLKAEAYLQADRKMMARELGIESPNRASLKNQIKTARM